MLYRVEGKQWWLEARVLVVVVIGSKEGEDSGARRGANKWPIRKGRGELVARGGR